MTEKHKITTFIFLFILCLTITGGKEANANSTFGVNRNNHNVFSSANSIKYIGHRGISGLAPENTIPAFELAGKLGFWGTECDVRTTSDGIWMILHDETVDRMTNGTGKIKNLSLAKVLSLDITSGNNINSYKGTKIPKLQDYLLTCKKWDLVPVIEMKPANNLQHYDKFIEIIKKYGNIEKTVVISSSKVSLNQLRNRDSYLTLGLICNKINKLNVYYVKALGNAFVDCSSQNITSNAVILCHENNIKVGAWTVDNTALANNLIQKGVDFLTTNKLLPEMKQQIILN